MVSLGNTLDAKIFLHSYTTIADEDISDTNKIKYRANPVCVLVGHLRQVIIAGRQGAQDRKDMLAAVASSYCPDKV